MLVFHGQETSVVDGLSLLTRERTNAQEMELEFDLYVLTQCSFYLPPLAIMSYVPHMSDT